MDTDTGWQVATRLPRMRTLAVIADGLTWGEARAMGDDMLAGWPAGSIEVYVCHESEPTMIADNGRTYRKV